jgi:hypothetical protein
MLGRWNGQLSQAAQGGADDELVTSVQDAFAALDAQPT